MFHLPFSKRLNIADFFNYDKYISQFEVKIHYILLNQRIPLTFRPSIWFTACKRPQLHHAKTKRNTQLLEKRKPLKRLLKEHCQLSRYGLEHGEFKHEYIYSIARYDSIPKRLNSLFNGTSNVQ